MKNDPCSCECNLCNCVRSLKKNEGLQRDLNPWPALNISGFIAQLVEHRTGIVRSRVQILLKSQIFLRLLMQLHKLGSQLQGSFLTWFHFRSSYIWFVPYTFVSTQWQSIPLYGNPRVERIYATIRNNNSLIHLNEYYITHLRLFSFPQIIKQHGNHLKASSAIVRLRLYSVLSLLRPKLYEGLYPSKTLRKAVPKRRIVPCVWSWHFTSAFVLSDITFHVQHTYTNKLVYSVLYIYDPSGGILTLSRGISWCFQIWAKAYTKCVT